LIAGFIGDIGSGKTASMIREVYLKHINKGIKVISNMNLNFPHEYVTFEDLMLMVENKTHLQDCILVLDELHIFMDSRTSMSKRNRVLSYFALQTRKVSVDLYYTTQYLIQVDIRIRNLTSILVECYTSTSPLTNEMLTLNVIRKKKISGVTTKKHIFKTRFVYSLYDTNEVISI